MAKVINIARFQADGAQVTREFDKMGEAGAKMSDRVKKGAQALSPSLRAVDAAAGEAKSKVEGLASSAGSLGTVMRSIGPAGLIMAAGIGAGVLAFNALHGASREAVRQLGAIHQAALRVGVSTEALQEWRFAVIGTGQAAEQADAAISAFAEKMGEALLTRGGAAFSALTRDLGFTPDEVANMRTIEESLPRIADRIGEIASASERVRIARELGLEPLLPLLMQGAGAFDAAAEAARRMGYVLDRDVLERAAEMNGLWTQASEVINFQLKRALIDLAPVFVELARGIAAGAAALTDFMDNWRSIEEMGERSLRRQLTTTRNAQLGILSRGGFQIADGGDAARGERVIAGPDGRGIFGTGLNPAGGFGSFDQQTQRDVYAALAARIERINRELAEWEGRAGSPGGGAPRVFSPTDPTGAVGAAQNPFLEALREEIRMREELLLIQQRFPKQSLEEATAYRDLEEQLRQLDEAYRAGQITEDELARLQRYVTTTHDAAAAERELNSALAAKADLYSRNEALRGQVETPQERIRREIDALQNSDLDPELVQRRLQQLSREYRDLAAAQYEASLQGRLLNGVIQGQIRNAEDLQRVLLSMIADGVFRELMSGGLSQGGGLGGFAGRVLERVGIANPFGDDDGLSDLQQSAKGAAESLSTDFIGSITSSIAEMVLGTTATATETAAKASSTAASAVLTKGMLAAAHAATQFAGAAGGDGAKNIITSLIKAGGRAGGGPLFSGARHAGAELGPEIAIFGGWGHAAPTEAFEGLAALARLARAIPAAPSANIGPAAIRVEIINQASDAVEVEANQRTTAEGEQVLAITLTRKVEADLMAGKFDRAGRARWNARAPMIRR